MSDSDFNTLNADLGQNSQAKLSSIDTKAEQPEKFPFDAFEFDNPDTNENPSLNLVSGWSLSAAEKILSKSASYDMTDKDGSCRALITTGASELTFTLYARKGDVVTVVKKDSGAGKVTVDTPGGQNIIVYSGGKAWELSGFELIQAGDFASFIYDGTDFIKVNPPYWHKIDNPATGNLDSQTSGWTADSFSGGLEITISDVPIGTICSKNGMTQYATTSNIYARKSGDTNISNTPNASNDLSHRILRDSENFAVCELWMNSERKVQIAVTDTDTDLDIYYTLSYLQ